MSASWSTRSASSRPPELTDLFSKFDPLIEIREQLLSTGVTDPFNLVMEEVVSPTVAICNGRETILLGTYNYMGMTFDPDVLPRKQALDGSARGRRQPGLPLLISDKASSKRSVLLRLDRLVCSNRLPGELVISPLCRQ